MRRAALLGRLRKNLWPGDVDATQVRADTRAPVASGRHVLLVEANPVNALLARTILKRLGCEVTLAEDGQAAVDAASANEGYDLILMDCQMPGMDGLEATRQIRAGASAGARTRIVALSANAFREDEEACRQAGMDGFLSKPVSPEDLRGRLERWTGQGARPFTRETPPALPDPAASDVCC